MTRVRSLHLLRIGLIAGGSWSLLAAIGYGVAYAIVGSGVLPNTTVSGRRSTTWRSAGCRRQPPGEGCGGDRPAGDRADDADRWRAKRFALDPADRRASRSTRRQRWPRVAGAIRRPAGLWKALFAHPKLNLAVSVDSAKLDAAVTALNSKIVGGGHDGGIEFHGTTPVAIAPVTGHRHRARPGGRRDQGRVPHVDRAGGACRSRRSSRA